VSDDGSPLPFRPGEVSNGEFLPAWPTARDRWITQLTLARVAEAADRLRCDRRRLLQSASGMAALLGVINLASCSGDSKRSASPPSSHRAPTTAGGTYTVPPPEDVAACAHALESQGEFIFDIHTHHVVPDGPWRQNAPRMVEMVRNLVPDGCTEADPLVCLDRSSYLADLFLASDTTVAVLTDVPNTGPADAPMAFDEAVRTHELADMLTANGATRVLLHNVIAPNFGDLQMRLDDMTMKAETGRVAAFKVYTAWGPNRQGFALDDPAIGLPVVQHAHDLGVRVFCSHKGLPLLEFDRRFNGPRDMVALSRQFPDMQFVVYHSAFERATNEGPYDPNHAATGVNSLVKALQDYGVPPNSNVWAELGTAWREVMSDTNQAAHLLGKLLTHVGEDRVCWGTDAIWFGSPQPQIMAFRAFQIDPALRERHGYAELTDAVKRKVFGLNAAQLYGQDVDATRCALDADQLAASKPAYQALGTAGAVGAMWQARGPVTRREMLSWLRSPGARWSP
jgi:predicted TIM-barrel fold metal-dependent hydrolase